MVLNLLWSLGMSKKGNIFFSDLKKTYFSTSEKKLTKNTWQIAKSHEFHETYSLSPIFASEIFLLTFHHISLTLLGAISRLPYL